MHFEPIQPKDSKKCVCVPFGKKALVPNVVSYSGVINACSTDSWRTSTELLQRMSQEALPVEWQDLWKVAILLEMIWRYTHF